ncbi:hypothetical protein ACQYAD_02830 [Neobacillus sp. SM06]|uniref:hypothetical protein n=1 Tax=Neobacillus sp. SM06 TaxID=3422492 RepID=UPI003D2A903E
MKNFFKKSLASLGVTAFAVGAFSTVSNATIAWDSDASWYGSGGRANVYAYTSQSNEPANYKITVYAETNDGSQKYAQKNPASASDSISVSFLTAGPVSSGFSEHEWVMSGESGFVRKSIDFH